MLKERLNKINFGSKLHDKNSDKSLFIFGEKKSRLNTKHKTRISLSIWDKLETYQISAYQLY